MATKKATTKKTSTVRKTSTKKAAPAGTKTTVRTVSTEKTPSSNVASDSGTKTARKLDNNVVNIVLAELIGTFVLTMVALLVVADLAPLFVGLTLAVLVMTIGAVSGSHVNPAVTFGLWAAGKLKAILIPFYWGAQFLGAMAAVVVMNAVASTSIGLDFSHFGDFSWPVFMVEMIGAAVFLFGLTSVVSRVDLSAGGKALGLGLSLFVGLVVASSLYASVPKAAEAEYLKTLQEVATSSQAQSDSKDTQQPDTAKLREVAVPKTMRVGGATLNPAIALAVTESQSADDIHAKYGINQTSATGDEPTKPGYSRLSLEVILATLIGAAVGSNLSRLVNYRFKL